VIFNEYLFPFSKHDNPFVIHNESNTTASSFSSLPIILVSVPNCSSPTTTRTQSLPISTANNHCQTTSHIPVTNLHPMVTRAKAGISKPKILHTVVTNDSFSVVHLQTSYETSSTASCNAI